MSFVRCNCVLGWVGEGGGNEVGILRLGDLQGYIVMGELSKSNCNGRISVGDKEVV